MPIRKSKKSNIQQVGYRPPKNYQLDLEIFSVAELRRRAAAKHLGTPQRLEFYLLICVTRGTCLHMVDFKPIKCITGTFLIIRPAQAQHFDIDSDWDGWLTVFRPEFLLPSLDSKYLQDLKLNVNLAEIPNVLQLQTHEAKVVVAVLSNMREDAKLQAPIENLQNLLRHQLYALLQRIYILAGQKDIKLSINTAHLLRFKRFQQLTEKHFHQWHQVSDYAKSIGCSEKSLTRAVADITGQTAKTFITSRINLEAKRLLAHTKIPVGLIGEKIGFDEATNFIKFFKREVGCSPNDFRKSVFKKTL